MTVHEFLTVLTVGLLAGGGGGGFAGYWLATHIHAVAATAVSAMQAAANPAAGAPTRKADAMWERLKASCKHSLTILWARMIACAGVLLMSAQSLIADPAINDAMRALLKPAYIPYYVIAIGLITEIVRRRTAGRA